MEQDFITKGQTLLVEKGIDWIKDQILKSALQDCVSHKIPIIARDHPEMEQDQRIAVAYSMCREGKSMGDMDGDDDDDRRPLGAQFIASLHEMACAMADYYEQNKAMMEPEVLEDFDDYHTSHKNMLSFLSERHSKRYPGLEPLISKDDKYPLGDTSRPPDDEAQKVETKAIKWIQRHVKQWWISRQKTLKQSDMVRLDAIIDFLTEVGKSDWKQQRAIRVAALSHARELRGMKKSAELPPAIEPPPASEFDWEAVQKLLDERAAAFQLEAK